jgi:hypothetical protein
VTLAAPTIKGDAMAANPSTQPEFTPSLPAGRGAAFEDLFRDPPRPHRQGEQLVSMALDPEALRFVHDRVDESCATLETGCGLSTAVFALTGARHFTITPAAEEFSQLRRYCAERGISTARVSFIEGASQTVLPSLAMPPLDLVLIDGSHGFPAPYIDWFYTAGPLKVGGHLIVDDTWLWSCQILRDFLTVQPQWKLLAEHGDRTAIFEKLAPGSELLEWPEQPWIARRGRRKWVDGRLIYRPPFALTPLGRAWGDLRRGDFRSLTAKLGRMLGRWGSR